MPDDVTPDAATEPATPDAVTLRWDDVAPVASDVLAAL